MIRTPVEDVRGRQTIASHLPAKVTALHLVLQSAETQTLRHMTVPLHGKKVNKLFTIKGLAAQGRTADNFASSPLQGVLKNLCRPLVAHKTVTYVGASGLGGSFPHGPPLSKATTKQSLGGLHEISPASRPCCRQAHRCRGEDRRRHHHSGHREG